MKQLLFLSLFLTTSAFAQMCEVDMVDSRGRRLDTFRAYGDDTCLEGMKECRKEIRLRGLYNRADCVRAGSTIPQPQPYPQPQPQPYPQPQPQPYPQPQPQPRPDASVRRQLNIGEQVIMNSRYVTVLGANGNGLVAVRSTDGYGTVTNGVRRESLAITNGCSANLCIGDSVISIMSPRYVTVAGLAFDGSIITRSTDGYGTIAYPVNVGALAETKGCVSTRYTQVCVGNTVISSLNRYHTVVGMQLDGRVVLRSTDGYGTLSSNVDPSNLVVTR